MPSFCCHTRFNLEVLEVNALSSCAAANGGIAAMRSRPYVPLLFRARGSASGDRGCCLRMGTSGYFWHWAHYDLRISPSPLLSPQRCVLQLGPFTRARRSAVRNSSVRSRFVLHRLAQPSISSLPFAAASSSTIPSSYLLGYCVESRNLSLLLSYCLSRRLPLRLCNHHHTSPSFALGPPAL